MSKYIEREAAFNAITDIAGKAPTRSAYEAIWKSARALKKIPAADVALVKRAHWIEQDGMQICSNCGEEHTWDDFRAASCDCCGANMDGGADNA